MGKYNYKDEIFKGEAKNNFLKYIANELAEANRLTRIRLQVTGGFISVNDSTIEILEDQA